MLEKNFKDNYIKLEKTEKIGNRVEYIFSISNSLKKFFNSNKMFIEYDFDISDISDSIINIPFVANIIPLVWCTNSILWIESLDREYYESLFRIRERYREMYPNVDMKGNIISAKVVINSYKVEREAALLFSGGLDAIATCIRIEDKNPLLINVYGWHRDKVKINNVFKSDFENISDFSKKNKLNSTFIQSNFATLINDINFNKYYKKKLNDTWWHGLQHGMCFIGHAIPVAYKYRIEKIYIASSFTIGGKRYTCSSDPAVDIENKYASGYVVHDGFELNRQDKIKLVVDKQEQIKDNYPLRVCSFNDKNCCECEKCFRSILGLVAEGVGKDELYNFGFEFEDSLKNHFQSIMKEKIQFLGLEREAKIHWPQIKNRMKLNKDKIKEIEFVEWFLNYDFLKERNKAILKYRVLNFYKILKKRMKNKNES